MIKITPITLLILAPFVNFKLIVKWSVILKLKEDVLLHIIVKYSIFFN